VNQKMCLLLAVLLLCSSAAWGEEIGPAPVDADAVALYQQGRYDQVVALLKRKGHLSSEEDLYLGLSQLRLGKSADAIQAWKEYVRLQNGGEGAREIGQYLTVLIREEAKRTTRVLRSQEKKITGNLLDPSAVAVSPFRNLGTRTYDPLSKGLAEMVITDLSKVKQLKVVERIQLQALLDELKLSQSGLVDPASAPRVGKLLGAGKITTGSFLDLEQGQIRLDAAVTQTDDGKLLSAPGVTGGLSTFYDLEKSLVFKILCGLGRCPESLDAETRAEVSLIHTKDFAAFRLYAQGLDLLDQGKYREAARSFFLATEEDPEFTLARRALLDTPMIPYDLPAMISGAEARGESDRSAGPPAPAPPALLPNLADRGIKNLVIPSISQQPIGATAPATVPVQVHVQFP